MSTASLPLVRRASAALRGGPGAAFATYLVIALLVHRRAHVPLQDLLAYTLYAGLVLTLPGAVLWRALTRGRSAGWFVDIVLGTLLGFVIELPAYLAARALGVPRAVAVLPVLAVAFAAGTRAGRALWRRPESSHESPARFTPLAAWTVAAAVVVAVAGLARDAWATWPAAGDSLRSPFIDEPFHLAVTGELIWHGPDQYPFVTGVSLDYHWLVYVHLASASWLTGIDPVVLLRALAPLLMVVLTLLGVVAVVHWLTGRLWPGVAAGTLLALTSTLDLFGWTRWLGPWAGAGYVGRSLNLSPTQTYATMLSVLVVLFVVEALRQPAVARIRPRLLLPMAWVLMLVTSAAKSTFGPLIIGSLAVVTSLALLRNARVALRRALVLTASAIIAMGLAAVAVFGIGSRSLTLAPLASAKYFIGVLGLGPLATHGIPVWTSLMVMTAYVMAHLAAAAPTAGLLLRGGWRNAEHQFLVFFILGGLAASFTFDHPGRSQFYFGQSTFAVAAIASGLGIARLLPSGLPWRSSWWAPAAAVLGLLIAVGVTRLGPPRLARVDGMAALWRFLWPQALVVLVVAGIGISIHVAIRGRPDPRWATGAGMVFLIAGMTMLLPVARMTEVFRQSWPAAARPVTGREVIAPGGIEAALWLRTHSRPEDVVATNAHCYTVASPGCDRRNFWISGWAQRRILVEGWAYIAPETVGVPSTPETNSSRAPFWNSALLTANDEAFAEPTRDRLQQLQTTHHVRWMFVDRRYPADLAKLGALATVRFRAGDYVVVELPE